MLLKFPNRCGSFTMEELRCLAASLGYQEDIFSKHFPLTTENKSSTVETEVILELIKRKVFNTDLHRTYNLHDGVYNVKVLEKALNVLSSRIISFTDLKDTRIAFQFYECEDLSGLEISSHVILRTLKMCGRIISPRKLRDNVKHIARSSSDRLTLYEFLELIPMCEKLSDVKKKVRAKLQMKLLVHSTASEVSELEELLMHDDLRELSYLDNLYEQSFFRPAFDTKPTWRIPSQDAINNKEWKKHVLSYQQIATGLDAALERSNKKVVLSRNGTAGQRLQFVDLNILHDNRERSKVATASHEVGEYYVDEQDCKGTKRTYSEPEHLYYV